MKTNETRTDFRALCQELMDAIDSGIPSGRIKQSPLAVRVDAALAQPEPQGPSDAELLDLADDCDLDRFDGERSYSDGSVIKEGCWEAWDHELLAFARAVWNLARR